MSMSYSRAAFGAILATIALPLSPPQSAEARPKAHHRYYAQHYSGCPLHRAIDGSLVDCHGWRLGSGIGWDNTCFNLDYLPSQFACSSKGRR